VGFVATIEVGIAVGVGSSPEAEEDVSRHDDKDKVNPIKISKAALANKAILAFELFNRGENREESFGFHGLSFTPMYIILLTIILLNPVAP
jgi:hypothetical protein